MSLGDNVIDNSRYLPCIQHENQNGLAYGCRAVTNIIRLSPTLKCLSFYAKKVVNLYLLLKVEGKTKSNQNETHKPQIVARCVGT